MLRTKSTFTGWLWIESCCVNFNEKLPACVIEADSRASEATQDLFDVQSPDPGSQLQAQGNYQQCATKSGDAASELGYVGLCHWRKKQADTDCHQQIAQLSLTVIGSLLADHQACAE